MRRWWPVPLYFLAATAGVWASAIFLLFSVRSGTYPLAYQVLDAVNLKGGSSHTKFREFDPQAWHDVVFIGSSHAYRGYDPQPFLEAGLQAFNLGTSAQTPLNSLVLVRDLLEPGNVGLLVIDVYRGAFELDGLESTADLVQNLPSDRCAVHMAAAQRDPRTLNMLAVRWMARGDGPWYRDTTYVGHGFSASRVQAAQGDHRRRRHERPVRERQLEALEALLRYCRSEGIRVVLVDHPSPSTARGSWSDAWSASMDSLAGAHGAPFLDLGREHVLDDRRHFMDHTHLNAEGARLFSLDLYDHLMVLGLLGPRP